MLQRKMKDQYIEAKSQGLKIIFIDEAIFSPATALQRSWSNKKISIEIKDQRSKIKTQALIAGISEDLGLESYMIKSRSFNQESYIEFLEMIRIKYPDRPLVLFMDNLSVHKSRLVMQVYEDLKITPIFNVPYSPQYNGIERYWFLIKQIYKKMILKAILKDQRINVIRMI